MSKRKRKKPQKRPWVQRRWSLKQTSSGAGPSPEVMAEYQQRARSMQYEWAQLDKLFPCYYPTGTLKMGQGHEGRRGALQRKHELEEGIPPERSLSIHQDRIQTVRLYFNDSHTRYFFLRHRRISDTFEKSITYGNRARAIRAWEEGDVLYVFEVIPERKEEELPKLNLEIIKFNSPS